jgi:uncharacterized linocin/CFP29 family protein
MYTAKIVSIKKDMVQATQIPFLDVEVQILDKKNKVMESRKFAYPLDTTPKQIKAEASKYLAVFEDELKTAESQKATVELNKKADATIKAIEGEME